MLAGAMGPFCRHVDTVDRGIEPEQALHYDRRFAAP